MVAFGAPQSACMVLSSRPWRDRMPLPIFVAALFGKAAAGAVAKAGAGAVAKGAGAKLAGGGAHAAASHHGAGKAARRVVDEVVGEIKDHAVDKAVDTAKSMWRRKRGQPE